MAKKSGRQVLVKFYLPEALHRRLKAHAAAGRVTQGQAVAELIEDHVLDYAKLRERSIDSKVLEAETSRV